MLSLIKPLSILVMIVTFILQCLMRMETIKAIEASSWLQKIVLIVYLPLQLPLDLFYVFFIFIPILFIIGLFVDKETEIYRIYSLLRTKNYYTWLHATLISLLLFIIIYFSLAFFTLFCLTQFFSPEVGKPAIQILSFFKETDACTLLIHQFLLFILSVYCMALLYVLIFLLFHHSSLSSLITICILSFSVVGGFISPKFLPFLPFTYGLLAFHEMNDYSFGWAYIGSVCLILVLYNTIFYVFRIKKDGIFMYK